MPRFCIAIDVYLEMQIRLENISEGNTDSRQCAEVLLGEELTGPEPKFGGEMDLSHSLVLTCDSKGLDQVPN